jgi:hypothetical protein
MRMNSNKQSYYAVGAVIVLIIIVVLILYGVYHSKDPNVSFSQYLTGLEQQATGSNLSVATTSTATTTDAVSAQMPGSSPASAASNATVPPRPIITVLSPSTGTSGLTVVIGGLHFDHTINYVTFGSTAGLHGVNGLPGNVVAAEASSNGTTLTFNVPFDGPSGLLCDATGKNCAAIQPTILPSGAYPVTVSSKGGVSNTLYFNLVQ